MTSPTTTSEMVSPLSPPPEDEISSSSPPPPPPSSTQETTNHTNENIQLSQQPQQQVNINSNSNSNDSSSNSSGNRLSKLFKRRHSSDVANSIQNFLHLRHNNNSNNSSNNSNSDVLISPTEGEKTEFPLVDNDNDNSNNNNLNDTPLTPPSQSQINDIDSHSHSHNKRHDKDKKDKDNNSNVDPCDRLSFHVGISENKNLKFRPTMEDVHTYVSNFGERLDWGYFAIFDGHAGKQAAKWCGSNLHNILVEKVLKEDNIDLRINLNNSFIQADKMMDSQLGSRSSGCTAAVAVLRWEEEIDDSSKSINQGTTTKITTPTTATTTTTANTNTTINTKDTPFDFIPTNKHKRMLYTANVGDTRLILCRKGKAIRLSYDHKSIDKKEQQRIVKAGGIMLKSRVNGVLAVTRSLGDNYMKNLVIGSPYTTATALTKDDSFLIIACDGLWDVCSDQNAVDLIKDIDDPKKASSILCNYAISKSTTDNVTVMVVKFDTEVFKYKKLNNSSSLSSVPMIDTDTIGTTSLNSQKDNNSSNKSMNSNPNSIDSKSSENNNTNNNENKNEDASNRTKFNQWNNNNNSNSISNLQNSTISEKIDKSLVNSIELHSQNSITEPTVI
ncbi:phosphoprotein phosphatase activity protein [[Candida] boidinii]|nr:phosphoprotein phosphatase activity protein [[Candida] boidinii]